MSNHHGVAKYADLQGDTLCLSTCHLTGSYEHGVPKIKAKHSSVQCMCVIQHRNWPFRSTILNAHGTNCSADGFYARTHINEPYLCYYVVCRSKLAEADAETCVFTGPVTQAGPRFCDFQNFSKNDQRFCVFTRYKYQYKNIP